MRLWKIGTHRLLGIYSGPSVEDPELPANLAGKIDPGKNWIVADFEVCPLEREKLGAMQAACIESAKNIVVKSD